MLRVVDVGEEESVGGPKRLPGLRERADELLVDPEHVHEAVVADDGDAGVAQDLGAREGRGGEVCNER